MRREFSISKKKAAPRLRQPVPIAVSGTNDANIAAVYHGKRLFGDFYDFQRVSRHLVLFGLLDVAGRHTENTAIVAAAQQVFRSVGAKLFSKDDINEAEAMIELSVEINHMILKAACGVRSCPAFIGCYNESIGTLCYSNAGHPPALVRDGTGITQLPATGLPFGLFSHVTHDAPTVALPPGAALLLVSRGVTEANCGGEEFGIERVEASLRRPTITSAEQLCGEILDSVEQFMSKPPRENDVTALALVRAAGGRTVSAISSSETD